MLKLIALVQAYNTKEDGATAIEYALIAAGIALAIATAVYLFGGQLTDKFTEMGDTLESGPS
ncbi:MAG: Flp family type IVb pilin [Alphaproteobacteria bacterium]|jgi:pilus assembly protein Flp/PilA|nr:Flp family type IVb pilin [Alphaproteobacteria bacterium]MCB1552027.1 Flp family type IVb pilin [Alphaproteobacteria bacterium]MCB9985201.1 Flp family type IVb pilin [Micavibrio sp.]HPQ51284.1 Flp family type IVb pilin [Alphaproteobacteria bacterium]HRK98087.1 Flp family type IVb pilin [Alphaproteobacteria bacterium]